MSDLKPEKETKNNSFSEKFRDIQIEIVGEKLVVSQKVSQSRATGQLHDVNPTSCCCGLFCRSSFRRSLSFAKPYNADATEQEKKLSWMMGHSLTDIIKVRRGSGSKQGT